MTPTLVARDITAAIDSCIDRPVLVVGSAPPDGQGLDLLARRPEREAIERRLTDNGFLPVDGRWARLSGEVFTVVLATGLPFPPGFDESRVYEGAEPLPGCTSLCAPSPAVQLLLAARSLVHRRWRMTAEVRDRVEAALERDPDAWDAAAELAPSCGADGALRFLRTAYDRNAAGQSSADRLRGAWRTAVAAGPARSRLLLLRGAARRPAAPVLVTFSGLDGCGKSTQVERLSATMTQLGLPATARRSGFRSGYRVRAALPFLDGRTRGGAAADVDPLMPGRCARTALGRHAWVGVVALINAAGAWGLLLTDRRARLVAVDRYAADAAVKLELYYGVRRATRPRVQQRMLRMLTPRPLLAFYLDVSPETSVARRPEEDLQRLSEMKPMYDAFVPMFGLTRLDGQRDADDLADAVATAVWRELSRRSARRRYRPVPQR